MARYQLRSGASVLVDAESSSNLDGSRRQSRRGSVIPHLTGTVIQYREEAVIGEERVEWHIPLASPSQRGILQSASVGAYGDELTLNSPVYGAVQVAYVPGPDAHRETPHLPLGIGYEVRQTFVRLD